MGFLTIFKRFFRNISFFLALALAAGIVGIFFFAVLIPKLSTWSWTAQFVWPGSSINGPTIIQRTEQVVLSQEEGLEQFVPAPRTAVVSISALPMVRLGRLTAGSVVPHTFSGILVTNDGLVATYANEPPQIEGQRFTVFFADGNASQARFLAYDPVVNVAYFRTERADTPAFPFANSTDIRQGRRFMALAGAVDSEAGKLVAGYISERSRTFNLSGKTVASADEWEGVFFPDRSLGSRFTGGAVVAMNGELIGLIGTLTLDTTEQSFILPANVLRQSLQRVIRGSAVVQRASIGAYYVTLTKETALTLGTSRDRGALIFTPSEKPGLAVISNSLAAQAGLRYGDIVTAVNGREINLDWPLSVALYEVPENGEVMLTVLRGGNEQTLSLKR